MEEVVPPQHPTWGGLVDPVALVFGARPLAAR
jgi:hypothetical protein